MCPGCGKCCKEKHIAVSDTDIFNLYKLNGDAFFNKLDKTTVNNYLEILSDAQDVGKKTHAIIEGYLKDKPISHLWSKKVEYTFPSFLKWKFEQAFELINSELMTWSEEGFAGTIDIICKLDGRLTLLCGYRYCYEERTGQEIENMGILKLEKDKIFVCVYLLTPTSSSPHSHPSKIYS